MPVEKKKRSKKVILLTVGTVLLVLGITLVLVWWSDVVLLFRSLSGMVLALVGLLVLYMVKD